MDSRAEAVDMAFVMSLARTRRVKYIGPDGTEVIQEDNRWRFISAEDLASGAEVSLWIHQETKTTSG
jgi:hypothetical protein